MSKNRKRITTYYLACPGCGHSLAKEHEALKADPGKWDCPKCGYTHSKEVKNENE